MASEIIKDSYRNWFFHVASQSMVIGDAHGTRNNAIQIEISFSIVNMQFRTKPTMILILILFF